MGHDLVFDPNTKSCVKEDAAPPGTCFDTSTLPPTATTPTTTTTPTTMPTTTTTPTTMPTTTTPTTTTTTTPATTGPSSLCEYEGQKLPFPGDCHKYYRCAKQPNGEFEVEIFNCGDWVFDQNQGSCVWPGIDNDLCPEEQYFY